MANAFVEDLNDGLFRVDAQLGKDLPVAKQLLLRHKDLKLGLVDAVVMAQAIRHSARAILTLDARHFRAVKLPGNPRLIPLDE